jgi:UDP-N-acetyl-D-mannosaminuronic acid dehydrogenase
MKNKIAVVGGAGHIGLPLSLMLARNFQVTIVDPSKAVIEIKKGLAPFEEEGMKAYLKDKKIMANIAYVDLIENLQENSQDSIVITLGTPVDEWGNPITDQFEKFVIECAKKIKKSGVIILRSTVTPGLTNKIRQKLKNLKLVSNISFCPERIAQGKSFIEMKTLPQIIGADDEKSFLLSKSIFSGLSKKVLKTSSLNAEFSKLFANFWRYATFAVANQIYITANKFNTDPYEIIDLIKNDYPRASGLPYPGFAAGPCLYKDTVQLIASLNNEFLIGTAAANVNEGVVYTVAEKAISLAKKEDLDIVILGAAFKADNDDYRSSLSFKLLKILKLRSGSKITLHDPYVKHEKVVNTIDESKLKNSVVILGTPHKEYSSFRNKIDRRLLVDIWGFYGNK